MEQRLREISELKQQAEEKYSKAKACINQVLDEIARSDGEFDFDDVSAWAPCVTGIWPIS